MKTYRSKQTGVFVGRQVDQLPEESYEIVEVPNTAKEELLKFLNELQGERPIPSDDSAPPVPATSNKPQPTEEEQTYAQFRADVAAGRVDLDETLLAAPLDTCLRLAGLIYERLREFKK